MTEERLLNSLSKLGFPMFEPDNSFDVNETLAEVIKNQDARLWEGFPVMLANAAEDYFFTLENVLDLLPERQQQDHFNKLLLLSLALYSFYHLSFPWVIRLKKNLPEIKKDTVKRWRNTLAHDDVLELNGFKFDSIRLKKVFEQYFEQSGEKSKKRNKKYEELSLEYALSQLFSPKQKELFKKKLDGLSFSKTEQEYYSRTVKKKIIALANPELHKLSIKLLQ